MRITVTEEHIRKGERFLPCHCPIALAIHEQTKIEASVGPTRVDLYRDGSNTPIEAPLPREASLFIVKFDRMEAVQPFTFELPLEAESGEKRRTVPVHESH